MSQGWSKAHAAGIMGNVQAESSFDPNADSIDPKTGMHHRGLFQDDSTRWAAMQAMFKTSSPSALQQFQFAQYELMHGEKAAATALNGTANAGDAGVAFDNNFERSGDDYGRQMSRGANSLYINSLPAGPAANIGDGSATGGGGSDGVAKVQVDVTHTNAPPGSGVKVSSNSPNVHVGKLKIAKAMVGA